MNRKIEEWESQSKPRSGDAKARWEKEREAIRERQAKFQQELARLQEHSGKAWEDVKEGSQAAWNDLSDAFPKAAEHFENGHQSSPP